MYKIATSPLTRSSRAFPLLRLFHASTSRSAGPSPLEVRLRDGLKSAMKSRDKQAATCLKSVLADATNAAKAGPNPNDPATESAVITALRKGIDKRKEAAEIYAPTSPSPSPDQYSSLTTEISLLSSYLPAVPSLEALSTLVNEVIGALPAEVRAGKGAMGPAMKGVLERLGEGSASVDRKEVGRLVQEALKR